MTYLIRCLVVSLAAVLLVRNVPAAPTAAGPWPEITASNKPWTRWWWLGSAVDQANLTRELTAIAGAGFGGVEITPIYGVKGEERRYLSFLSPEYVRMLAYTTQEAQRLGLGVDMATGTGWPFGGPKVTPRDAELQVSVVDGKLDVKPTRFTVKRAAPGGGGPVLNPYSADAMTRYLEPFTAALATLPTGALRAQFHDSFEYKATWANEVLPRFKQLHGYELMDHLAEFDGKGDPDTVARIKADYRSTIADLHMAYVQTWTNWAHRRGELARNQAHGAPGNLLDLYSVADIPETELFGAQKYPIPGFRREPGDLAPDPQPSLVHRLASSAAHVAGHPLASSETFTWLREHFREAPSQMKPEIDELFVCGINHLFYHGTAYSPADAPWPGWLFYAATEANPRNPLWDEFAQVNGYIARCQSLLQAGQPDNDVLLYWPVDDLWHSDKGLLRRLSMHASGWLTGTPTGDVANALLAQGYTFDFVSDRQLDETRCEHGVLRTPGASYRTLLVPKTAHLAVATLQRLLALAQDGATVLFVDALPADVPGYGQLEARRAQFKRELVRLEWSAGAVDGLRTARLGQGRALLGSSLPALLREAGVQPEAFPALGLQFIRRQLGDGQVYFVTNLSARPAEGWVALARPAHTALLMDPMNGMFGIAALRRTGDTAEVYLQLKPGESCFLRTDAAASAGAPLWTYYRESGASQTFSGAWQLEFLRGGPALPRPRTVTPLRSWTDASDPAAAAFAGTARYHYEFDLPAGSQPAAWRLELGDVRETAVVTLNGEPVRHVWSLPYAAVITAPLAPHNVLTIDVTNTAANRIRDLDRRHVPWHRSMNFVNVDYKPFDASSWPLQPSGLLGPVRLVALDAFSPGDAASSADAAVTGDATSSSRLPQTNAELTGDATPSSRFVQTNATGASRPQVSINATEASRPQVPELSSRSALDLTALPSPVLFRGDATTAYRDPAAVYHDGWFYLFFTLCKVEPSHQAYSYVAESRSRDLVHWSSPTVLTPRDLSRNYGSPGDVVRFGDQWVLCLQTYPRPNGEKYGNDTARIWTMASPDLEHWGEPQLLRVKGSDVPVEKMGRMIDPFLLQDKDDPGKWWCFYKQNGVSMSWSRDLQTWTYTGRTAAGENPCVVVDRGEYVLFHSPRNGIGMKRSPDLQHWTDLGVLKLGQATWPWAQGRLTAGFVLDLRRDATVGKALMFFHGSDYPESDPRGGFDNFASLGVAWSDDLRTWHWPGDAVP